MSQCMRCGEGITEKNYIHSWTLMCKDCDKEYHREQKEKIKEQSAQAESVGSGCLVLIVFFVFIGYYLLK